MHPVASFQIFLRDNKPRMNSRYPFLTQDQILSKLRQQWKQMDETKRILFSKLVTTKKVKVDDTKRRTKKIVHPKIAKPRCPFTNRLVKGVLTASKCISDGGGGDFAIEYFDKSKNCSSYLENTFAVDCLNTQVSVLCNQSSLRKGKTYTGRVFALHERVPEFFSADVGQCAAGILKSPRKSQKTQLSRVTFSPFDKTIHIKQDSFSFEDDSDQDDELCVEGTREGVNPAKATDKEVTQVIAQGSKSNNKNLNALIEGSDSTSGGENTVRGEKSRAVTSSQEKTQHRSKHRANHVGSKNNSNNETGDSQHVLDKGPQTLTGRSKSLNSTDALSHKSATKSRTKLYAQGSKSIKTKSSVSRGNAKKRSKSNGRSRVEHKLSAQLHCDLPVTVKTTVESTLSGSWREEDCEQRRLRMTPERARRQRLSAVSPLNKKVRVVSHRRNQSPWNMNHFWSQSTQTSKKGDHLSKDETMFLDKNETTAYPRRDRTPRGKKDGAKSKIRAADSSKTADQQPTSTLRYRNRTAKSPHTSASWHTHQLLEARACSDMANSVSDNNEDDRGGDEYDDDEDDAVLIYRPDISQILQPSDLEQNDVGEILSLDDDNVVELTEGQTGFKTYHKLSQNNTFAAHDNLLENVVPSLQAAPSTTTKTAYRMTPIFRQSGACTSKKDNPDKIHQKRQRKQDVSVQMTDRKVSQVKTSINGLRSTGDSAAIDSNTRPGLELPDTDYEAPPNRRRSYPISHKGIQSKPSTRETHAAYRHSAPEHKASAETYLVSKPFVPSVLQDDDDDDKESHSNNHTIRTVTANDRCKDEIMMFVGEDVAVTGGKAYSCSSRTLEHDGDSNEDRDGDTSDTDNDDDDDDDDIFCRRVACHTKQTLHRALARLTSMTSLTSPDADLTAQCTPASQSGANLCSPTLQLRDDPAQASCCADDDEHLGSMFQDIDQYQWQNLATPATRHRSLASAHHKTSSNFMEMFETQGFFL